MERGGVQSRPAVKIFGKLEARTKARTSYPSSMRSLKSLP